MVAYGVSDNLAGDGWRRRTTYLVTVYRDWNAARGEKAWNGNVAAAEMTRHQTAWRYRRE